MICDYHLVISQNNIHNVTVATNGIVPSRWFLADDLQREWLKSDKLRVRISDYRVSSENEKKLGMFVDYMQSNGIHNEVYCFASGVGKWYQHGFREIARTKDDGVVKKRYDTCAYRGCLTLEDSRLGRCSRAPIAEQVQGFSSVDEDYCIVTDTPDFRDRLDRYVKEPCFMTACRYCNGSDADKLIEPAIQLS